MSPAVERPSASGGSLEIRYEVHGVAGGVNGAADDELEGEPHGAGEAGLRTSGDIDGHSHTAVLTEARPVLLVHGFASNSQLSWADTGWLRAFKEAGRTAITVDLRGHGQSTKSHEQQDYSPDLLARDLLAVLDEAGIQSVDVVGYSMGCRVAVALAALAPKRVSRLVLGGVGTRELFASWDSEDVARLLLHGEKVENESVQSTLTIAMSVPGNDPKALLACVRGMAGPPIEGTTGVPTLIVAGERDEVASDAAVLAERMGAEFVSVPKRHHFTAVSSRVFKQAALDFLDAAQPDGAGRNAS